jgi:hypothetical protein
MKKLKFFILFITLVLISCERDDICAESTETTPRLKIEFYDASSVDDLKSVPRLTLYGEGLVMDEMGTPIEPIASSDATIAFNENVNAADLPLQIGTENTVITSRFVLEKDSNLRLDDTGVSNIDILEISYTPEFAYVSRACGYKSIFTNLTVTLVADADNWISNNIEITETTVENENTVHVRIFH